MADENVFISWSGERSRDVAVALYEFLPDCIQAVRPWVSFESIDAGRRWNAEVTTALNNIRIGVVVVTPDNLESPWLLFETGALARAINETARVCPYVIGMEKGQLRPPLGDFQASNASADDTFALLSSINAATGAGVEPPRLRRAFDSAWSRLDETLKEVIARDPPKPSPPRSPEFDQLAQLTAAVRDLDRRVRDQRRPGGQLRNMLNHQTGFSVEIANSVHKTALDRGIILDSAEAQRAVRHAREIVDSTSNGANRESTVLAASAVAVATVLTDRAADEPTSGIGSGTGPG